jgi:HSP20 family protein
LRNEFTLGNFKRSFSIDENMNTEAIQAKYEDGLLKLYIPKKENALPVTQSIQIQ